MSRSSELPCETEAAPSSGDYQRAEQPENALQRLNLLVQSLGVCQQTSSDASLKGKLRRGLRRLLLGSEVSTLLSQLPELLPLVVQSLNAHQRRCLYREQDSTERIRQEVSAYDQKMRSLLSEASRELSTNAQAISSLERQVDSMNSIVLGLESIISKLSREVNEPAHLKDVGASNDTNSIKSVTDYSYVLLENRFRGSEQEIRSRLADYVELFEERSLPILEIGAGRGELQQLFKDAGIHSYGVELDQAMVQTSREKGFDVQYADGIAHLREREDRSLSGIIAIQVVEHLPMPVLEELLALASRKVVQGGTIVFETINTSSVLSLTRNYFRDPTHEHPLHPDTLEYMAELAGLAVRTVIKRSPYPDSVQLPRIQDEVFYPRRWKEVIEQYNAGIGMLNSILFDHQDYALVATPRC